MNKRGNSSLLIVILIALVAIVAASAASYYFLKSQGRDVAIDTADFYKPSASATPAAYETKVSDGDDVSTIESELNATGVESTDADLQNLNNQATGL